SPSDYEDYGGALFGMDTNNGGMYLEGDPAAAGNQARFVAYEADWLRPSFQVWNLNHEYTHYLDGRFDMYGDFSANMTTPTVWWSEGLAEHVAYCYLNQRYDAALSMAGSYTYTLNQLFDTDYGNQDRVYRWGYLAVSFMMERHRADVSTLLGFYRKGDWTGARSFLKSTIGSRYDAEFRSWLGTVNTNGVNCANGTPPANVAPTAGFTFSTSGLTANFTDTSTDPDGSVASWAWSFGDGSSSTVKNPSKTYAQAGTYTVTLTVKDNKGAASNPPKTQQVTVRVASNQAPVANFSCIATGLTLNCTDSSSDADGSVVSWAWTFGDGSSSTARNPSKTFAAAGTYTVTLTVKDNAGASSNPPKSQSFTVSTSTPNLCPGR
ncbi:MAG: collagenase, partial [Paucibacter sp.]|nr:collagenase [Roseateles sp.]